MSGAEDGFEEVAHVFFGVPVAVLEHGLEDFVDLLVFAFEVLDVVLMDAPFTALAAVGGAVEAFQQEAELARGGDVALVSLGVGEVELLEGLDELLGGEGLDDFGAVGVEVAQVLKHGGGGAVHFGGDLADGESLAAELVGSEDFGSTDGTHGSAFLPCVCSDCISYRCVMEMGRLVVLNCGQFGGAPPLCLRHLPPQGGEREPGCFVLSASPARGEKELRWHVD